MGKVRGLHGPQLEQVAREAVEEQACWADGLAVQEETLLVLWQLWLQLKLLDGPCYLTMMEPMPASALTLQMQPVKRIQIRPNMSQQEQSNNLLHVLNSIVYSPHLPRNLERIHRDPDRYSRNVET